MTEEVTWNCRHHPTDWWHEVGCPHMEWTKEQLYDALVAQKKSNKMLLDSFIKGDKHDNPIV